MYIKGPGGSRSQFTILFLQLQDRVLTVKKALSSSFQQTPASDMVNLKDILFAVLNFL